MMMIYKTDGPFLSRMYTYRYKYLMIYRKIAIFEMVKAINKVFGTLFCNAIF